MVSCKIPILVIRVRFPGGAIQVFYGFFTIHLHFFILHRPQLLFEAQAQTIYRRWRTIQFQSEKQNKKILSIRHKLCYIPPYPLLFLTVVVKLKKLITKWRKNVVELPLRREIDRSHTILTQHYFFKGILRIFQYFSFSLITVNCTVYL